MRIKIGSFIVYKEKAGVISKNPIWIIFHSCYMYEDESLFKTFYKFITEYKNDKNIVG